MDSKKISIIAIFTSLAFVLNMSPIKIPAPYAPFLIYQLWEVPIVVAFLLFGLSIGVLISIINTLGLLVVFPGALPTGPLYNFIATISMLFGMVIAPKGILRKFRVDMYLITIVFSTILGLVIRVLVMTIVNWALLPFPPPVGFSIPAESLPVILPLIGLFNATLALYTIPISFILERAIKARITFSDL